MARDTDDSYAIRPTRPVDDELRRVVDEQTSLAIAHIDDESMAPHETIHEVRKRCKEARAALRLFRGSFDDYSDENAWYRDTGRLLSDLRDANAFVETWDDLVEPTLSDDEREEFAEVRPALVGRREALVQEQDMEGRIAEARERLVEGRERIEDFELDESGFDAIADGLRTSYRRGRERLAEAYEDDEPPGIEVLHEWRKRIKYHRYHAGLLTNAWSDPVGARRDELKELSDLTGDAHDLSELVELLGEEELIDEERRVELADLATRRRRELEATARPLGERVFAEDPDQLVERFRSYWEHAEQAA
jgi:CHAD domain-containing protein